MHRTVFHLWPMCVIVMLAGLAGCQHGEIPTVTETDAASVAATDPQQEKVLRDILKYQRETGSTLESLAKEIERREAVETQTVGPTPLQRDLAVARALLVAVRRAVHAEDFETALATLGRLEAVVDVMQGETPAARINSFLERAALALQGTAAGVEADVASTALLAALDVALKSGDAPLVPEVAQSLETTKALVDKGDYRRGLSNIEELISTVAIHPGMRLLKQVEAGVQGTRQAMQRNAGLVVLAELDQLSDLFNRFATMIKAAPATVPDADEEEESPEEEETSPEEPAESAEEEPAEDA